MAETRTLRNFASPADIIKTVLVVLVTAAVAVSGFNLLKANTLSQVPTTLLAIVWGVSSVVLIFYSLNLLAQIFPTKIYNKIVPYIFIGPAVLIMGWYLFLPTLRSLMLSFMDKSSTKFVWFANYKYLFTDRSMLVSIRNTLIWLVLGTGFSVLIGLLVAILAERSYIEKGAKTFVFLPMSISLVGAGVIFKFMYSAKFGGAEQIGLLNSIVTSLGFAPQNWLGKAPWNNLFLIAIFVWLQTGFAMVVLSAALKAVPEEMLEAARIDGAGELTTLVKIVIPNIRASIISVSTTILLAALKCFDIVYSMTNGMFGTEVLASQQYKQMFTFQNYGRGSAIAILILIGVSPVIYYNLKEFHNKEAFK
ncbi:sugar ABC transporter permease [uncultured Treponema sp.]|uniref:carbohydrate ABC transporter permease n=1 Tax=uncultured Treponema sp. TaxID=162155 RepID=UPI0025FFDC39|nr:sugar ABC transporter permease [uncultured Treponema sp.]